VDDDNHTTSHAVAKTLMAAEATTSMNGGGGGIVVDASAFVVTGWSSIGCASRVVDVGFPPGCRGRRQPHDEPRGHEDADGCRGDDEWRHCSGSASAFVGAARRSQTGWSDNQHQSISLVFLLGVVDDDHHTTSHVSSPLT
jgi:hypothetical protein